MSKGAPELPAAINSEALELARALRWIPFEHHAVLIEQHHLTDFQAGWYLRLYLACCSSPIPGYLGPIAHPSIVLWKFVGAHSERAFQTHSAAVMSCFSFTEIDGEKYLYHPRLLGVIVEQLTKLKRRRGQHFHISSFSTSGEQLPLLLFQVLRKEKAQEKNCARSVPEPIDDSEEMWAFRVKHALKTQGSVTGELAKWAERLGIPTEAGRKAGGRKG